jgi:hypothetical protein
MITRSRIVVPVTLVLLLSSAGAARAAVTWGSTRTVGPPSIWNPGNALASTSRGLVMVWSSDCPPPRGRCATDRGPYMGVFAQRHRTGGWAKPLRLSQRRAQAERATVAASGARVLAGWVTQTSYRRYRPRAPRVFYVRRSVDAGRRWSAPIRLSPKRSRVDYPSIAMTGTSAYAVWTAADTGAIRLATSIDAGAHWNTETIGVTSARPAGGEGFAGYPVVAASGTNVVVTWYADDGGAQVAKGSSTGGGDLAGMPADTLTPASPSDGFHYAGARGATDGVSNDVVVAYTTDTGLAVRTFDRSSFGGERQLLNGPWPTSLGGVNYAGAYGPAVQPSGNGDITVVFGACKVSSLADPCDSTRRGARIDVFATTSSDHGGSWTSPARLNPSKGGGAPVNESPSLATPDATTRVVIWNARDPSFLNYGLLSRTGQG